MHWIFPRYASLLGIILASAWVGSTPSELEPYGTLLAVIVAFIIFDHKFMKGRTHINMDRRLLREFMGDFPTAGAMEFIRDQDFGSPFKSIRVRNLLWLEEAWSVAEREFQDAVLERMKNDFINTTNDFIRSLNEYTEPAGGVHRIPQNLAHENLEEFERMRGELNRIAQELFRLHQDFLREGRRRLGGDDREA